LDLEMQIVLKQGEGPPFPNKKAVVVWLCLGCVGHTDWPSMRVGNCLAVTRYVAGFN
jgi:hypothetical protein